jgi:hypothetical protein
MKFAGIDPGEGLLPDGQIDFRKRHRIFGAARPDLPVHGRRVKGIVHGA